jgi:hypothetical protein
MGQYLSGYILARRILKKLELNGKTEFKYDPAHPLYRAREAFFVVKIALTIAAAVILVYTLVSKLFI